MENYNLMQLLFRKLQKLKLLIVMLLEKQMFLFSQTFNQEILAIKLHNVWVCLKQSDRFYKD